MAKTIDIKLLIRLILKRWFWFVIAAAVSMFVAMVLTAEVRPDRYQATTSISSIFEGSTVESLNGARLLFSYSSLINSSKIANAARDLLPDHINVSARQIQSMVSFNFGDTSTFLFLNCTSSDPQLALFVANAVADAFVAEIGNITGDATIRIYDRAVNASMTFSGRAEQQRTRTTIPTICLFLLLIAIIIWALFSDRVKSVSEAGFDGEVNIIGVIPRM